MLTAVRCKQAQRVTRSGDTRYFAVRDFVQPRIFGAKRNKTPFISRIARFCAEVGPPGMQVSDGLSFCMAVLCRNAPEQKTAFLGEW